MRGRAVVRSVFLCPCRAELALAEAEVLRLFTLVAADGTLDLPEYPPRYGCDRCAQRVDCGAGVEVEHIQKIFRLEVFLRPVDAPAEQRVSSAGGYCVPEESLDAVIIILCHPASGKDAGQLLLMFVPVFRRKVIRNLFQLFFQQRHGGPKAEGFRQIGFQRGEMFLLYPPEVHGPGGTAGAGIRNVKYVPQAGAVPTGIYQCNALGAALHIPAHPVVPEIVSGAGRCIRALGVNHELILIGILVQPGRAAQETLPRFLIRSGHEGGAFGHLRVILGLFVHLIPPFL